MVKNSFSSVISQEEKKENGGSVEFQVVSFTNKIRRLTSHLELHKKDYLSQRGLRPILGKRQRLLSSYLSKIMRYTEVINQLDIREGRQKLSNLKSHFALFDLLDLDLLFTCIFSNSWKAESRKN